MNKAEPLTITIMDKEYRVACPEDEKDNLLASAKLLNNKLSEIKQQGSVIGAERIAIMAALNMSHEILLSEALTDEHENLNQRMDALSQRINDSMRDIQLI
jgi:cell division protein ZapA